MIAALERGSLVRCRRISQLAADLWSMIFLFPAQSFVLLRRLFLELVTVLEEPAAVPGEALLAESALATDRSRPEEDSAWSYLQPAKKCCAGPVPLLGPVAVQAAACGLLGRPWPRRLGALPDHQ